MIFEMNVQAEKLHLIEWLVQLQDLNVLEQIKELKKRQEQLAYEASLKPMTMDEKLARAKASEEDIKAGSVHPIEEVMKENWD